MASVAGFDAYDRSGTVAALSRPIVTGLLRGQLRFGGVVITDSLGQLHRPRRAHGRRAGRRGRLGHPAVHRLGARRAGRAARRRSLAGRSRASDADASYRRIIALKRKLGLA